MSVFGFGNSYYARGQQDGIQPNPQTSPVFSGLGQEQSYPQMQPQASPFPSFGSNSFAQQQGINFAPQVTTPWANNNYQSGPANRSTAEWAKAKWKNPIADIFGGADTLSGAPGKYDQIASAPSIKGTGRLAQEAIQPNQAGYKPQTFDQLYSQIQGLSIDRLNQIDLEGKYQGMFNRAAQEYSNAFANPYYASSFGGSSPLNPVPGMGIDDTGKWADPKNRERYNLAHGADASWTKENVSNHLQDAYMALMQRLNEAGVL